MWKLSSFFTLFVAASICLTETTHGKRIYLRLKPEVSDSTSRSLTNAQLTALKSAFPLDPIIKVMPRSTLEVQQMSRHRLFSYYSIWVEDGKTADEVIEEIMLNPAVDIAYEEPEVIADEELQKEFQQEPASPLRDLQGTSVDYTNCDANYNTCQKYMLPPFDARASWAVGGVNAFEAQRLTGIMGETVTIALVDVDSLGVVHEDLKPLKFLFQGVDAHVIGDHPMLSAGIMLGQKNGFGVTGISPNAEFGYAKYRASELIRLKDFLKAGDIVQASVGHVWRTNTQNFAWCPDKTNCRQPIDGDPVVRDTFSYFTKELGIHVVISATNGATNLDHTTFSGNYGRDGNKDSWTVYAGAIDPRTGGKASFSAYGSRVDVSAWGRDVTTTTYVAGRNNAYSTSYSGTSASCPIVAGCIAFLQSLARAKGLGNLAPNVMRQILVDSGHPIPRANSNENIGPQPDLVRAVQIIEQMAGGGTTYTTQSTTTTSTTRITTTDGCASCSPCVATSGMSWDDAHCAKCANGARPADWPCQTAGFCKCSGAIVATTTTTTTTPAGPAGGVTTTTSSTTTTTKGSSSQGCASCSPCVSSSGMSWEDDHCAKCANGARPVDWPCQTAGFCRCR